MDLVYARCIRGALEVKWLVSILSVGSARQRDVDEAAEQIDRFSDLGGLGADGWDVSMARDYHDAWTFYFKAKGGYSSWLQRRSSSVAPNPLPFDKVS
ncbi:hypothetical protein [Methylobacterium brachiatum]